MTKVPSTKAMLAELNKTLKLMNKKQLGSWKGSKEQLKARMEKADKDLGEYKTKIKETAAAAYGKEILDRIEYYNSFAVAVDGFKTIKVENFTMTPDELETRIKAVRIAHREKIANEGQPKAKAPVTVKVPAAKAEKKKAKATSDSPLTPILDEIGMTGKVARTKLRKAFGSEWKSMSTKEIRKFLTK